MRIEQSLFQDQRFAIACHVRQQERNGAGLKKNTIYHTALSGERCFYYGVIVLEIITYTFSFLVSGLAKKDIFNLLEGKPVTLGIHSFGTLIGLNVTVPLLINMVKQMNAGLTAKLQVRLKRNIKMNLYENFFREKPGTAYTMGYGETISFFRNECEDLAAGLMEYYYQLPAISLGAGILFVMLYVNPVFAVISVAPAFGMAALTRYLGRRIMANREDARRSTGEITTWLENMLGNIEYFKLAAEKDSLGNIFAEKCRQRSESEIRDRVLDRILSIISENSAGLVMGIVLLVSIPLYRRNLFSVGEFVMFEYYYAFLASLPDAVGKLARRKKQSEVSAGRLQRSGSEAYAGSAEYCGGELQICVESPVPMEREITVKAHRGETILLRGGKERERGLLLQRLFQACTDCLPQVKCGYVPGQPVLFHTSVREGICFGEPFSRERFDQVLKKTDLAADLAEFKEGIERQVGKRGGTVSGGQRKRIGIAAALYSGVELLFLEGLSEDVDRRTEEIMLSNILGDPEKIIFVASDSERLPGRASQIVTLRD